MSLQAGSRATDGDEQRDLIGPGGEEAEELGRRVKCPRRVVAGGEG